jgi:hypothetical protein
MILKFEEWLINQQERDDLIGDLAREPSLQDVNHKSTRRKPDEHKNWAEVVIGMDGSGYIPVFNDAWQEFLLAKQAAQEPLD